MKKKKICSTDNMNAITTAKVKARYPNMVDYLADKIKELASGFVMDEKYISEKDKINMSVWIYAKWLVYDAMADISLDKVNKEKVLNKIKEWV